MIAWFDHLPYLISGAIAIAALGVFLLGSITVCGFLSDRSRRR